MNRIEQALSRLQEKGEKAFITYITAGLPDYDRTEAIIRAQEEAGTDIIELGIPFSDPVADGPVIQAASYDAIQGGATLEKTFLCMQRMRSGGVRLPIVFMMYYNMIVHYGVEVFARRCVQTGVDGLIIPDLPYEEQEELRAALLAANGEQETILIQLVSPVSGERIPLILQGARGFVYCVSSMGVTGQEGDFHWEVVRYLSRVRELSEIPVMVGFGIRTAADVAPMKEMIDGAIVGTHFINLLRENHYDTTVAAQYCSTFKRELNQNII